MKAFKILIVIFIVVFIGIQFIPVDRENPPVDPKLTFDGPENVLKVVKQSCYDCHSNETIWPWYAYVAPVSWLVTDDVSEGRKHMNFSRWNFYFPEDQDDYKREIWKQVSKGEMPLGKYLIMHSDAKLTQEDIKILKDWTQEAKSTIKFSDEDDDE